MVRPPAARPAALLLAAGLVLGGCRADDPPRAVPPAAQGVGPGLGLEQGLGLAEVEPGVWVPEADAAHWGRAGSGLVPPPGSASGQGLLLRSAHVQVETDLPAREALPLLRVAQAHVEACMARWGEALDLRLPREPLVVELHARRIGLEAALAQRAAPAAAQAWYDRERSRLMLAREPATAGALPVEADLRHELVHALLDRASPDEPPHAALERGGWLWLWEGVALAAEDGVGVADGPAQRLRRARLSERVRRDGVLDLAVLCALPAAGWQGRHYDQAAAWMQSLDADAGWRARQAGLLRALLRGDLAGFDAQRAFGRTLPAEQARFTAWLAGEGVR